MSSLVPFPNKLIAVVIEYNNYFWYVECIFLFLNCWFSFFCLDSLFSNSEKDIQLNRCADHSIETQMIWKSKSIWLPQKLPHITWIIECKGTKMAWTLDRELKCLLFKIIDDLKDSTHKGNKKLIEVLNKKVSNMDEKFIKKNEIVKKKKKTQKCWKWKS